MRQDQPKWAIVPPDYVTIDTGEKAVRVEVYGPDREKTARRIVRAVNAYRPLVSTLTELTERAWNIMAWAKKNPD